MEISILSLAIFLTTNKDKIFTSGMNKWDRDRNIDVECIISRIDAHHPRVVFSRGLRIFYWIPRCTSFTNAAILVGRAWAGELSSEQSKLMLTTSLELRLGHRDTSIYCYRFCQLRSLRTSIFLPALSSCWCATRGSSSALTIHQSPIE